MKKRPPPVDAASPMPIAAPAIRSLSPVSARRRRVTTDAKNDGPIKRASIVRVDEEDNMARARASNRAQAGPSTAIPQDATSSWAVEHANIHAGPSTAIAHASITANEASNSSRPVSSKPRSLQAPSSHKLATARIKSTMTTTTITPPLTCHRYKTMQRAVNFGGKGKAKDAEDVIVDVVGDEEEVAAKELHKRRRPLPSFTTAQDELPQVDEVANGGDEGDDEGSEQNGMDGEEVVEENEAGTPITHPSQAAPVEDKTQPHPLVVPSPPLHRPPSLYPLYFHVHSPKTPITLNPPKRRSFPSLPHRIYAIVAVTVMLILWHQFAAYEFERRRSILESPPAQKKLQAS
ncbi:hypothetical protein M422DRAFT_245934 [Sphaerobolus stellatus SS14]|nr:hypothetical protein M422DRAFT_245934 [Sphaerobolus stellatus SS14]